MKYTGIALMLLGLGMALFGGVSAMTQAETVDTRPTDMPIGNILVPVAFGLMVGTVGAAMYFYGGRGYHQTRNPAVRN
jgi:uncharacterized sodium:solute symporter family permease YidK